ncbi:MAG: hypothetical protein ACTSXU_09795 [Promethearchaeota archaeon]
MMDDKKNAEVILDPYEITEKLIDTFRNENIKKIILNTIEQDDKTMDNIIKAAAAHVLLQSYKLDYPGDSIQEQLKMLYQEMNTLFDYTISDELEIKEFLLKFHSNLFKLIVETPKVKYKKKKESIIDTLEDDFIEIMRTYPEYYLFDFLKQLIRLKQLTEKDENSLEKNEAPPSKDRNLDDELSSVNKFKRVILAFLKVKKLEDLNVQYLPIKKLCSIIFKQVSSSLPISERGIKAYNRANKLKNEILMIFKESNKTGENLDVIEERINEKINTILIEEAKNSPNELIYFLEWLLDKEFKDILELLHATGINSIEMFARALLTDYNLIEYKFNEQGIEIDDLNKLLEYDGQISRFIKLSLEDYKNELRGKGLDDSRVSEVTIESIIKDHLSGIETEVLSFISNDLGLEKDSIIDLVFLEVKIKELLKEFSIRTIDELLMILNTKKIISNITKEIFLSVFIDITRHVNRIIEFFIIINYSKKRLLSNIESFNDARLVKPWEVVNEQEPLILELMKIQESVAYILNKQDPYNINAFILSKICNITFKDALKRLKEDKSPIYFNVVEHPIILDNLKIVSRIAATDLLFRFQEQARNNVNES